VRNGECPLALYVVGDRDWEQCHRWLGCVTEVRLAIRGKGFRVGLGCEAAAAQEQRWRQFLTRMLAPKYRWARLFSRVKSSGLPEAGTREVRDLDCLHCGHFLRRRGAFACLVWKTCHRVW